MTADEKSDLSSADWKKRRKENHRDYLIAKGEDVEPIMKTFEYHENNSGGEWWLDEKDYSNLEKAGWFVQWSANRPLGRVATMATKKFDSIESAVSDWEKCTGKDYYVSGCPCCGQPHSIYEEYPL